MSTNKADRINAKFESVVLMGMNVVHDDCARRLQTVIDILNTQSEPIPPGQVVNMLMKIKAQNEVACMSLKKQLASTFTAPGETGLVE